MKMKTIPDASNPVNRAGTWIGDSFSAGKKTNSASLTNGRYSGLSAKWPSLQIAKKKYALLSQLPGLALLLIAACSQPIQESEKTNSGNQPVGQVPASQDRPILADARYVSDALCTDCHREIFDSFQQVAMSKSFYNFDPEQKVESFADNQFFHQPSGNHYEMNVVNGKLQMNRYRLRRDGSRINDHAWTAD